MRLRIQPWLAVLLIGITVGVIAYFARRDQHRVVHSDADMVALLPHRDLTTAFLNVDVLRRAKLLNLFQASTPEQEHEYRQFVQETGFDYTRDIDVLTARGNEQQIFFVIRGKFDWTRLRSYAKGRGGSCNSAFCQVPTDRAGRWASFLNIQTDVIGLAVSADPADVLLLSPRKVEKAPAIPAQPVWVSVAHSVLADPKGLPLPLRIFALAMQSAESVTLSIGPGAKGGSDFELRMEAVCQNAAIADTSRNQLEIDTGLLKIELQREGERPSRADLTGLLTSGKFWQSGNRVIGSWPVHQELLKSLQ